MITPFSFMEFQLTVFRNAEYRQFNEQRDPMGIARMWFSTAKGAKFLVNSRHSKRLMRRLLKWIGFKDEERSSLPESNGSALGAN